jgi:large subunit ribosomal protein L3
LWCRRKTSAKDGYEALQVGFERRPLAKCNKPEAGHWRSTAAKAALRYLREIRVENAEGFEEGQELTVEQFAIGDRLDVTGTSKAKGFTGTVKRWGFHVGPHGPTAPCPTGRRGPSAASAYPSRVVKGKKMPGQMGNAKVTVKNLEVVDVRPEENLLVVKGAVPGPRQGLVLIQKAG